jgi:hypothetical protein
VNIETVIYMAVKVCTAVKPRASTDEDTTVKPFRAVVAVGSTGVRRENSSDSSSESTIESVH